MDILDSLFWAVGIMFTIAAMLFVLTLVFAMFERIRKPFVRSILVALYLPVVAITSSLKLITKRI